MFSLLVAASLVFSAGDAELAFNTAKTLVEKHTPRDSGSVRSQIAANFLLDAASMTGADVRLDRFTAATPKGKRMFVNLSAKFESNPDSSWVVLVSHYDTKHGIDCPGANDGASTSGLLVGMANALGNWRRPRGNVMLLWTDGEECMEDYTANDGLWGSRHAAEKLKQSGVKVKAVICLDMIGDRDLNITIPANGDVTLSKIVLHAARKAGHSGRVSLADVIVIDDHVPFMEAGFKAVDLIDFNFGSAPGLNDYWHTPSDTMDKISVESLKTSGEVVAKLLEVLLI